MNYDDKHTEDSLVLRLGRFYSIKRGLDCAPNITMTSYRDENLGYKFWSKSKR